MLRQKFYFQKTAITHTFVTLKIPLKSKVILDIIFKCLIHKPDTGHNKNRVKNVFENCYNGYKKLALPFLNNRTR